jgi:predicted nucleic acid-binding protein
MKSPLILDSSATLSSFMPDEISIWGDALLEHIARHGAHVPNLWALEVSNSLLMAERRKRMDKKTRLALLKAIADLPIEVDSNTTDYAFGKTAALAEKHALSVYDAAYLELAIRLKGKIATCDAALISAAKANKISIFE